MIFIKMKYFIDWFSCFAFHLHFQAKYQLLLVYVLVCSLVWFLIVLGGILHSYSKNTLLCSCLIAPLSNFGVRIS